MISRLSEVSRGQRIAVTSLLFGITTIPSALSQLDIAEETTIPASSDNKLFNRNALIGSWGGFRDELSDHGVEIDFTYSGEVLANIHGGIEEGTGYNGLAEFGISLDLEKLISWRGGAFRISSIIPHGDGISGDVGDLQGISNIEAHNSGRLYELYLAQSLLENRLTIKAGNLLADSDFATTEYGTVFINGSFGWPPFISANTINSGPAFFVPAPGVHVLAEPKDNWYFQLGVFDGDSFDNPDGDPEDNETGVEWELGGEQGAFIVAETGLHTEIANLPGTFKLGGWYHTAKFLKFDTGEETHGNFGVFVSAEQMLWTETEANDESEQGLGAFFRFGFSPEDRNIIDYAFDTGLNYKSLIPGREEDSIGLGATFVNVSDDVRNFQEMNGDPFISDHEIVIELAYEAAVTPWFTLQPSFQWVEHPGTTDEFDNAFVIALRGTLTF